jgi:hypothetical protein
MPLRFPQLSMLRQNLPFGGAAGGLVPSKAGQGDAAQGGGCLPVAAAVEALALGLAGGGFDRADPAQRCQRDLGVQAAGIVAGGDEQRSGCVGADAVTGEQVRSVVADGGGHPGVKVADFLGKGLVHVSPVAEGDSACAAPTVALEAILRPTKSLTADGGERIRPRKRQQRSCLLLAKFASSCYTPGNPLLAHRLTCLARAFGCKIFLAIIGRSLQAG